MIELVLHYRTEHRTISRAVFACIMDAVEPALKVPKGWHAEVGITFVGTRAIRALNNARRKIDMPTDVLSFPLHMKPIPGYTTVLLGDLFICPDIVRVKARESGDSVRRRMAWTIVHGMLHLAGYDHEGDQQRAKRMFAWERNILNTLNL